MARPFRFSALMPEMNGGIRQWRDAVRQIEDLGYSTVGVPDHFTQGAVFDPLTALTACAAITERLRVLSLVLDNDYRHPVMLHKAAAFIDALSEGRLELGLGAGWMASDYNAAGIGYDRPGVRINRLEESLRVIKGLFADEALSLSGCYYKISGLEGLPKPAQRPRPPILIGGGAPRILSLAAREADIVHVNYNLRDGVMTQETPLDMLAERVARKVSWVRSGAAAVGREMSDLELMISIRMLLITDSAAEAAQALSSVASRLSIDPSSIATSPTVLVGSLSQCCETLYQRREQYGFSYFGLGPNIEMGAALVDALSGQ